MNKFKLIAIRTGSSLSANERSPIDLKEQKFKDNHDYLKSLKPNETFLLFQEYSLNENGSVLSFNAENKNKSSIYKLKENPHVNLEVSAIVGKNGSGKSSLVEILYLAIHNLAVKAGILFNHYRELVTETKKYLRCDLYFILDDKRSYRLKLNFDEIKDECVVYEALIKDNKYEYKEASEKTLIEDLKELFYAISVNYSIYGLNSREMGRWINHLFHKNDSYQTPLVINPMRIEGNFDINRENYLTKYRLLSNSILKYKNSTGSVEVVEGIKLTELIFTLNRKKIINLEEEEERFDRGRQREIKERTIQELIRESNFENIVSSINIEVELYKLIEIVIREVLGVESKYYNESIKYQKEIELYIVKKLYRIAFTYREYWEYLRFKDKVGRPVKFKSLFDTDNFISYLYKIKEDTSHITLKLRQALNYLVNNPLINRFSEQANYTTWDNRRVESIDIENFREPFNEFSDRLLTYEDKVINCLPPSLFDVSIYISKQGVKEGFDISRLSSGEQQLINSIQSTLYHLNNLESYSESRERDNVKYKNALIVFDEIELYFHPEYQRRIVYSFIREIDQLSLKLIEGIHVIFITHSPFVLSDIPHTNQLNIIDGASSSVVKKTFASNIHELLQDTFFLETKIGDFSESIIDNILFKLNFIIDNKGTRKSNTLKKELLDKDYFNVINLIGDKLVRNKMLEMYSSVFKEDKEGVKFILESKMKLLQEEIKKLEE